MDSDRIVKNLCVGCNVDMGEHNPRQYCCKTYCINEYFERDVKTVKPWICGECTITNTTEKCILCDYTSGNNDLISRKISNALLSTPRAKTIC